MPRTFKKGQGTTNVGLQFENLIIAKFTLDLIEKSSVKDFHLSSNDGNFGMFDDVILDVEPTDNSTDSYAIQVKQCNKTTKTLDLKSLLRHKSCKIEKYFESFQKHEEELGDRKLILMTTIQLSNDGTSAQLVCDEINFTVEIVKSPPLALLKEWPNSSNCYKFRIVKDTTICPFTKKMQNYEDFFERFYFYTNQINCVEIKQVVKQKLQEFDRNPSIFYEYMEFINEWNSSELEKEMLDKDIMSKFLTLLLLSPSIKPYSTGNAPSENAKILQTAVAKFTITAFDKSSLDEIRRIWSDAKEKLKNVGVDEVNRIRGLYCRSYYRINDLNKLSDEDCSKLMWHIGEEYPLIVQESPLIYKAIKLCSYKKYVIIRKETSEIAAGDFTIWEKLSDLLVHPEVFEELIGRYRCQLPAWEVSLRELIEEDEQFLRIITTNELIKMVEKPYVIYEEKEALPEPYISRYFSGNFIDLKYLEMVAEHTFIVLSNVEEEDMRKYSKRKNFLVIKGRCDVEEFNKICERRKEIKTIYHLMMISGHLQLIRRKGEISVLNEFHIERIEEEAFYNPHNQNSINIITGGPGMGKFVILKSIKNNFSTQKIWNIILTATEISIICHRFKKKKLQGQIEDLIFNLKYPHYNEFHKTITKLLMHKGKISYSWDSLDEISTNDLNIIIDHISSLSQNVCVQWITSRPHLKGYLEKKFNVLSISIAPFDDRQQIRYFQNRLELRNDNIIETIKKNIAPVRAIANVLGIPLQIFMLTQLFLRDRKKFDTLVAKKVFSLSDLYHHFIDETLNIFYKEKVGMNFSGNKYFQRVHQSQKITLIRNYEKLALKVLFNEEILTRLGIDCTEFLKETKQEIYHNGLITKDNDNIQFVHISYAEYLAASYFAEHYNQEFELEDIISHERYDNVRFFFDSILAKNSPPHLAVLCKNLESLKECENNLGELKDLAGRNLLHLAASWGGRYELFEVTKSNDETIVEDKFYIRAKSEKFDKEMIEYLLESCDINEVDDVFKLNCLEYAEKFECLFSVIIIENVKKTGYLRSKNDRFICNILYYSAYSGYGEIIDTYKSYIADLKIRTGSSLGTLLHLTSIRGQFKIAELLIKAGVDMEAADKFSYAALHYASERKQLEVVQLLISYGANVEIRDKYHRTPLHYASTNGQVQAAQLLIGSGATIDAVDKKFLTPLHYALMLEEFKIARLLIMCGANIEARDKHGRTSLHLASESGQLEVAQWLINSGANIKAQDTNGRTPLHLASESGQLEVAQWLINSGANMKAQDKDGRTPLHFASENVHVQVVQVLIDSEANTQFLGNFGSTDG